MDPNEIEFNIHDIEPGWTCITFNKPPKLAKSRTHALLQFLETWRERHPARRIEKIEFVQDGALVRGLNLFWSAFTHAEVKTGVDEFKVDDEVESMYGLEYAEALMHDALAASAVHAIGVDKILMISKRLIAIIILRKERLAFITTHEKFLSVMNKDYVRQTTEGFEHWKQQASNGYFCATLPFDFEWKI